jgi:hypothetical protein
MICQCFDHGGFLWMGGRVTGLADVHTQGFLKFQYFHALFQRKYNSLELHAFPDGLVDKGNLSQNRSFGGLKYPWIRLGKVFFSDAINAAIPMAGPPGAAVSMAATYCRGS